MGAVGPFLPTSAAASPCAAPKHMSHPACLQAHRGQLPTAVTGSFQPGPTCTGSSSCLDPTFHTTHSTATQTTRAMAAPYTSSSGPQLTVGYLGLGIMGQACANNLLNSGLFAAVHVWNRNAAKVQGATAAASCCSAT